jgi:D-alanyl-D-alanine carboxypeptidase/D-alanyl-D-alanine-endopeptidase (penicillin-binding protein 4)
MKGASAGPPQPWRRQALAAVALAGALAVAFSGCAPKAARPVIAAAPQPATRTPLEQLQLDLGSIFSTPAIDHAFWGVAVRSLKSDELLFSLNAARMQTPASNQKLITTAVAAEKLGWDFRYTTTIYATGPQSGSTIDGDLVIVSNGDPTINPRHPERWAVFDAWAKQLHARGLQSISGRLIGDDNAFAEPGWGVGWAWDDLSEGYGAAIGGLQYNENQVELLIGPALEAGARAIISVSPPDSGIRVDNAAVTVAADQPSRLTIVRIPGSANLKISGQVAAGSTAVTAVAAVPNPTLLYLNALRAALERNGIIVGGTSADIDDLHVKPDYSRAAVLIEDRSAPLSSIIDVCLKWSRNEYAETLLYSLAPTQAEAPADAGLEVVRETLRSWGVAPELYIARDGSGLSRNDYASPDAFIGVLTHMWKDPRHMQPFRDAQPHAGTNGTLANRLKNTAAYERVWAKTGSMSNVRSLSGYLLTLDNEPIVFSFMSTGFRVPASQIDATMDEALVRLVKFPRELHEE